MKNLSILIPTIPTREKQLNRLLWSLQKQIKEHNLEDKIEIIIYKDNFEKSVGHKRNSLIDMSKSKYSVFFDDDDSVSDDYCEVINSIIENNDVDQIGYKISYSKNRWFFKKCVINVSDRYKETGIYFGKYFLPVENINNGDYHYYEGDVKFSNNTNTFKMSVLIYGIYRRYMGGMNAHNFTNQKIPIRTKISKKVRWDEKRDGFEDIRWIETMRNSGFIGNSYYISEVLYFYKLNIKNSHMIWGSRDYQKLSLKSKIENFKKHNKIKWENQPITLNVIYVKENR